MIESAQLYTIAGIILFSMGLYALIVFPHLLRRILGMNIMGTGVFMVFVAIGYRGPDQPPDPVPHALVITGIVVAVCATGLSLSLATQIGRKTGLTQLTPPQQKESDDS